MAYTFRTKIAKEKGAKASAIEELVATAFFEIESNSDNKADLAKVHISAVREVEVAGGKGALVVFVPYRQLKDLRKVQASLATDLENKLGKQVVFLAQRRVLEPPQKTGNTKKLQKRPRSRTLTAVHDAILDDLVFPAEVAGRRTRVKIDGSRTSKVNLDSKEDVENRLETYSAVYKKLTGKDVSFHTDKGHARAVEAN